MEDNTSPQGISRRTFIIGTLGAAIGLGAVGTGITLLGSNQEQPPPHTRPIFSTLDVDAIYADKELSYGISARGNIQRGDFVTTTSGQKSSYSLEADLEQKGSQAGKPLFQGVARQANIDDVLGKSDVSVFIHSGGRDTIGRVKGDFSAGSYKAYVSMGKFNGDFAGGFYVQTLPKSEIVSYVIKDSSGKSIVETEDKNNGGLVRIPLDTFKNPDRTHGFVATLVGGKFSADLTFKPQDLLA